MEKLYSTWSENLHLLDTFGLIKLIEWINLPVKVNWIILGMRELYVTFPSWRAPVILRHNLIRAFFFLMQMPFHNKLVFSKLPVIKSVSISFGLRFSKQGLKISPEVHCLFPKPQHCSFLATLFVWVLLEIPLNHNTTLTAAMTNLTQTIMSEKLQTS